MDIDLNDAIKRLKNISILHFKISLEGNSNLKFNRYTGFAIRSLCYNVFKRTKPYNPKIHDENVPKPFSVSPLLTLKDGKLRPCYYKAEKDVYFELILNSRKVPLSLFTDHFSVGKEIKLDEYTFLIKDVKIENFQLGRYLGDGEPPDRFTIEFYTPTVFRYEVIHPHYVDDKRELILLKRKSNKTILHLFPEPKYIVRNILRALREVYGVSFSSALITDVIQYIVDGNIVISKINRLVSKALTDPPYKGFIGNIEYLFRESDDRYSEMRKFIYWLLKFGELFGVGVGRTNGMGRYLIIV